MSQVNAILGRALQMLSGRWGHAAILVGLLLRLLPLLIWIDPPCENDECSYLFLGDKLSAGEPLGMTDPKTGRFWMWAPAYPYLLAATTALTGDGEWFKLVQLALFPLLAWLGWRLTGRGRAGIIAMWLLALNPTLVYFSGRIWSETLYVTALFGLLAALGWSRGGGAPRGLLPGLVLGFCVLLRGVATYMLPVLIVGRLWGQWRQPRAWASSGMLVLAAVLTVAPWSISTSQQHGGFILSDVSLGRMMYLGNNDFQPVSFDNALSDPVQLKQGRPQCRGHDGLLAYDACEVANAKAWVQENPGEFVARVPLRISQLFNPNSFLTRALRQNELPGVPGVIEELLCLLVLISSFLAVVGGTLGAAGKARGWLPVTVVGLVAYQVAVVSLVAGLSRYRMPLDALGLLGAAMLLDDPRGTFARLRGARRWLAAGGLLLMVPFMLPLMARSYGWMPPIGDLPPGGERPDVVLISVDTLRPDHLGAWGYARDTSPSIDALAASGVRFEHARSPSSWTLPSHATLLTGLLPVRHQLVNDRAQMGPAPMLQELFQAGGYATGGFVTSWFVGSDLGFDRGFDHFDSFGVPESLKLRTGRVQAERAVDTALRWLNEQDGRSAFLFLQLSDASAPYKPPYPYRHQFDRSEVRGDPRFRNYLKHKKHPLTAAQMTHQVAQYDEEIAYLDAQLARLFEALEERDAIVVLTSAHGEEFGERGSWGHGHTLNPEQLRVPLILAGTGHSGVVDQVVGLQDVAPTLAELAGFTLPSDGLSLAPAMKGEALPVRSFFSNTSGKAVSRLGVYRDGLRLDWDLISGDTQLFNDPTESEPVRDEASEAALMAELLQHLGQPWHADTPQVVDDGHAIRGGELSIIAEGDFAVVPVDATVGDWSIHEPPPAGAGVRLREASDR